MDNLLLSSICLGKWIIVAFWPYEYLACLIHVPVLVSHIPIILNCKSANAIISRFYVSNISFWQYFVKISIIVVTWICIKYHSHLCFSWQDSFTMNSTSWLKNSTPSFSKFGNWAIEPLKDIHQPSYNWYQRYHHNICILWW